MDFFRVETKSKNSIVYAYPNFIVGPAKDIMIRGGSFYAIWDEKAGMWSTKESDVQRLVDAEIFEFRDRSEVAVVPLTLQSFESNMWDMYKRYISRMFDCYHLLDNHLTFQNTAIKRSDYCSRRLPYALQEGPIDAYEELISTLYSPAERQKLEWAIGSIVAGDSRRIQKFLVLYGEAGSGKSTVLNIIQKLFEGYCATFEAKALGSRNNQFATEAFRGNPLVAIQHDGDLSHIEDNTLLNSIVAHEEILMKEKYKSAYPVRLNCMLFMGTNQPVKITDAKSGILRRLIDVTPSGRRFPPDLYFRLMEQIEFELGAIAFHCLNVYQKLGKNAYSGYKPMEMMYETNDFANFIDANFETFLKQEYVTLQQAWDMYKEYCDEALVQFRLPKRKVREELKSYFDNFIKDGSVNGERVYSYYVGFHHNRNEVGTDSSPESAVEQRPVRPDWLILGECESRLQSLLQFCPAQYGSADDKPTQRWDDVQTQLCELDPRRVHYVRPPERLIVIDFDLKDKDGNKSLELNLEAASKWPKTYAEVSKGGNGLHLHYWYDGDPTKLSSLYSEGIEVKVFTGKSSLRRKLSLCNNEEVAHISSGLPLKGEKMVNFDAVKSERKLRELITRNLRKEIHPGTKPSVDFIHKILEDAYSSGLHYDVTDMRPAVMAFANNSTHHATECVRLVAKMKFASEEPSEATDEEKPIIFYDVEVFPNLFVVCWKIQGEDQPVLRWINPGPEEVEKLFHYRLVGFNNRRYDNHILYARYMGYDNEKLYTLSQRIVGGSRNCFFGEAYNLSYTDVYDFAMTKQSLKKWEIALHIHHQENEYPWDQPVPEDKWGEIADYCANDVVATEKVFDHLSADFKARLILSELSGLTPNDTTQQQVARIIFGKDKNPQEKFVYTDLSTIFPGYKFDHGKSTYMGEEVGEGGYVYAEPGMYRNVALLDIASMHPTSIENLNAFGPYTERFSELKQARIAIKHRDVERLGDMLGGILVKYLDEEKDMDALDHALKIAINIVYGLTSAKFDNKFRDPRNVDNIVAKRGALFMVLLKNECMKHGIPVAHIKTDSIKIPNATAEQIQFVMDFGKKYGYDFEHEATYERMCLVNDAVYIAKYDGEGKRNKGGKGAGTWTATGAQFLHPFVFKTLFSHDPITFDDICETKSVSSAMYLDLNEGMAEGEHNYRFVGRVGQYVPVKEGAGGGVLYRSKDDKMYAVGGTTGYRWMESEVVKELGWENLIDENYHRGLVDAAIENMKQYGDVAQFFAEEPFVGGNDACRAMELWCQNEFPNCRGCGYFDGNTCKYAFDVPF